MMIYDIKDVRIDTISTEVGVRVTYLPTGLWVYEQLSISRHQNEKVALAKLRELVEAA